MNFKIIFCMISLWSLSLHTAMFAVPRYQFPALEVLKYSATLYRLDEGFFFEKTLLLEKIAKKKLSQKNLEERVDEAIRIFCEKYNHLCPHDDAKILWQSKRVRLIEALVECAKIDRGESMIRNACEPIPMYE